MPIVAALPPAASARPRFRTPPWHDAHPARRAIGRRLDPDHLARGIDRAVARLDLDTLRTSYGRTGSPAHPPELLLRVALFEMRRGRHCPAEWDRDARESEPVRWLLRGAVVARSCWYAFRDRLAPLLLDLNAQLLALALAAGLTTATRAAQDGTLVAANASRHKLLNRQALERRAAQLAAAQGDEAAAAAAAGPAWLAATAAGRRQQRRRLERAQARLDELEGLNRQRWASKRKAAAAIVVSPGDPEAVVARDKEKVYRPLYNVQLIDDLDSPLILGYDVFAQQNDSGVLAAMLARLKGQVGHAPQALVADGSYAAGADLAAAAAAGVTLYAPVPGDGVKDPKWIPKREFTWLPAAGTYVCPQGHRLVFEESWRERRACGGVRVWRYRCPAEHCQGCPLRERCTRTPAKGRAVTRQEHEELIEALRARMATPEAQALYRLRKQTVELANADLKQHRKLRRFSGRGLARARCAVGLIVLAHNLLVLVDDRQEAQAKQARAEDVNRVTDST
jgi:transposase